MARSAEEIFAFDAAKLAARDVYGTIRKVDPVSELIKAMVKSMILDILEDEDVSINVFDSAEKTTLQGALIMWS